MRIIALILALVFVSCGKLNVEHEVKGKVDPIKIEPIQIQHYLVLDTAKLEAYYRIECEKIYTLEEDIEDCVTEDLAKFIEDFTYRT